MLILDTFLENWNCFAVRRPFFRIVVSHPLVTLSTVRTHMNTV